jgi:F5/8 type C domain
VLSGNKTDLESHPSNGAAPPEFFNPPSAINLAFHQPTTASSTAPGSSTGAAVDGLGFTSWLAGDEDRSFITVDLGAKVQFQRVMLRPIAGSAIHKIKLQSSDNGIIFTEIPGSDSVTKRTINITFRPVTARFLRVEIRGKKSEDGPTGFEEISVHAK